ncbi:pheromone receptor [Apodospora peruviana]|uniref:Pheromone receptor n=1 Tax=Apodospora peruviana TaxID=516989 RepID=A0AAE0I1X7_9PEZI|nr:pheromone receptor [Apodospora peruviana]
MASNDTTRSGGGSFDPLQQILNVTGPDGSLIPVSMSAVDEYYHQAFSAAINFGCQIGATLIMLVIMLVMTPKNRFNRLPTVISIAALVVNFVRMILISLYYVYKLNSFYVAFVGDAQFVPRSDWDASVAATALSLPVTILIELALIVQAWSMLRLWPTLYKVVVTGLSLVIVVTTIAFSFACTVNQIQWIMYRVATLDWLRETYIILLTASTSWFCFLFIARLVAHMWESRSILPSLNVLNAMDVLVITNGLLMVIPVIFAILQFIASVDFGAGSLAQTSVIIVLPLGTLVAQRLANPTVFSHPLGDNSNPSSSHVGTGGSRSSKRPLLMMSGSHVSRSSSHPTSHHQLSRPTATAVPNSYCGFQPGQVLAASNCNTESNSNRTVPGVMAEACYEKPGSHHFDPELARIEDLESGMMGVRVDCRIECTEERIANDDLMTMASGHGRQAS